MRIVQRVQAEEMNANKHKREKVEMFTEARPEKEAGERSARTAVTTVCPALSCLPWQV